MEIYSLLQSAWASAEISGERCWVLDENFPAGAQTTLQLREQDTVVTNRFDVCASLLNTGATPHFCDFDLTATNTSSLGAILYRVSKERPVSHRILNQAAQRLGTGGYLFLAGDKDEGIKNYVQKACTHLGFEGKAQKHGAHYLAKLRKTGPLQSCLDDKKYCEFREVAADEMGSYISKPGVYGWNKIDKGSHLLRACLQQDIFPKLSSQQTLSAIDLGCGYGYLSLALFRAGIHKVFATDNNAAALAATEATLAQNQCQNAVVCAGDAGDCFTNAVHIVVCNPPFHQGFSVEADLTEKFVAAAARLTSPQGVAVFVVNAFIPIEKVIKRYFCTSTTLINDRSFKVITLGHRTHLF